MRLSKNHPACATCSNVETVDVTIQVRGDSKRGVQTGWTVPVILIPDYMPEVPVIVQVNLNNNWCYGLYLSVISHPIFIL